MIEEKSVFPKVSILIPVFNRKDYIAECIQSALDQTFTDFEIVVVDNASEDGTWEICQKFAAMDGRVRIFRNDSNIGPVRNWKRCVDEAKGKFSKILFSDDCLEPNCLSEMVPKLGDPTVALVFCAARIGKSRDESIIAYSRTDSSRVSSPEFLSLVLSGKAPVSPGAVLIRTDDLLKNLHIQFPTSTPRNFEKNGAGPDVMILLLTAHNYLYVANISMPLVYFRSHAGSFTIENSNNNVIKGYRSAIALFLIENHGRQSWIDYLALSWLQQMRLDHRWRNPRSHLIEYEGSGSLAEVLTMLSFSFRHVRGKLFRKP
ncbi:glycosyltransferase family 2 protein [Acidovorax sp.]|uniref:glycosyltransferase family 2 protein n=1 Tax=Acidovorax sp. TaxID=1872122 RepID=UPI0025BE7692|nr:glycosyltransferase family 2 protein [Acidovorax sp.]